MSYFSSFIWRPLVAALARARGSSHAGSAAAASAALDAVNRLGQDVHDQLASGVGPNSASSLGSAAVRDLEDGLRAAVDAFLTAAVPVGLNGLAVGAADLALTWAENHAHDYVAGLFHHARSGAG